MTAGGSRLIPDIVFLIAGFGALPTHHCITLRAGESRGSGREIEASSLATDDSHGSLATLRNTVAEGDVVVLNDKLHHQFLSLGIGHRERAERPLGMDITLLALSQAVVLVKVAVIIRETFDGEILRPVTDIGAYTEG